LGAAPTRDDGQGIAVDVDIVGKQAFTRDQQRIALVTDSGPSLAATGLSLTGAIVRRKTSLAVSAPSLA